MKGAAPVALLGLLVTAACGKVGDPLPPIVRTPQSISDLRAVQRGFRVILSWTNPDRYVDNNPVTDLSGIRILENGAQTATIPAQKAGQPQSYELDVTNRLNSDLTFAIQAETRRGRVSAVSNTLSIHPVDVPGAPRGLRAVVDRLRIILDWEPPEHSPDLAQAYVVRREDLTEPFTVSTTHFEDSVYEPDKTYTYTVTAARGPQEGGIPGLGSVSVTVTATDTTPPATPTGLRIESLPTGAFLRWRPNTERDLKEYLVYRSDQEEPISTTPAEGITDPDYRPGLSYQLVAVDEFGNRSQRSTPQSGP